MAVMRTEHPCIERGHRNKMECSDVDGGQRPMAAPTAPDNNAATTVSRTITSRTEWSLVGHYWILSESSQKRGGHSEDVVRIV